MRVVAGKYKGKKLLSPLDEITRPTSDKAKESLFNIIGRDVIDSTCLDLFAGSGALGIEAMSRGAKKVVFNDFHKKAIEIIEKNINSLKGREEIVEIHQMDFFAFLNKCKDKFNIVFLDPPYALKVNSLIIDYLVDHNIVNEDSVICVETPVEDSVEKKEYMKDLKEYKYGIAKLTIIKL